MSFANAYGTVKIHNKNIPDHTEQNIQLMSTLTFTPQSGGVGGFLNVPSLGQTWSRSLESGIFTRRFLR